MSQSQVELGLRDHDLIALVVVADDFGHNCPSVLLSPAVSSWETNHFHHEGRGGGIEEGCMQDGDH